MANSPLVIEYYTDILCVWAWIAQRRVYELHDKWGSKIEVRYHYLNIFGDTENRIGNQWVDKGGFEGFGEHVIDAAAPYSDAAINPDIWKTVRPVTSANAHLVLKAAELNYSPSMSISLADNLRQAFFVDCLDIGKIDVILAKAAQQGMDVDKLNTSIENGKAAAALMSDYGKALEHGIKGSPSWLMNEGRQLLFGNVGFRVLNANVEETLKHPDHEASWC